MEKITSFTIDHLKLQPGVYVSRKDPVGDTIITTFDIRMTSPNEEPVMNTAELHQEKVMNHIIMRIHMKMSQETKAVLDFFQILHGMKSLLEFWVLL